MLIYYCYLLLLQHDPNDEPTCASLAPEFFEFDLQKDEISKEQLKELLYDECVTCYPILIAVNTGCLLI